MTLHGGNIYAFAENLGCSPSDIIDFSSNIHFEQAVNWCELSNLNLVPYADPNYTDLKQTIKERYALVENTDLELFNGASAAIFALLRFLKPENLVFYAPLYGEYSNVAKEFEWNLHFINRFKDDLFAPVPKNSTVIFVNPSTPDGKIYDVDALFAHWKAANCTIIIDESFLDFCDVPSMSCHIESYHKLFIVKSLCKFYGCAGVRIGFIAGQIAPILKLRSFEPAWKLSSFDMEYMKAALKNTAFIVQTQNETKRLRAMLEQVLIDSKLFEKIYEGSANFVLARLKSDEFDLQKELARFKILIRNCDSFDFLDSKDVRFAVKSETNIQKLAHALASVHV
ncbi:MAG: aminotransferase class I/II-fold pyridoxal phosphate-dependent enzyme [Methylococcales bacterium]|nr:aminotransferase class I/II-fold pyridoxal phosphate-dependent enzyme [Methylococcales bacterium]